MGVNPAALAGLTVDEKLDLISELWDSIEESATIPPLTDAQSQELMRRRAEGLGESFTSEVERVVTLIERYPGRFPFMTVKSGGRPCDAFHFRYSSKTSMALGTSGRSFIIAATI